MYYDVLLSDCLIFATKDIYLCVKENNFLFNSIIQIYANFSYIVWYI